jgi:prepilin-type N-terminal cleavage/methylation domain-containing protein
MRLSSPRFSRGFTLPEILIAMGIMTIVGMMIFLVLNSGMVLYAKNTAVNTAHQQARAGVDQMLQNIHGSVSIPQLVDSSLQPIDVIIDGSGNPVQAPGISFQSFVGGPFPVVVAANATDTSITLFCPGYTSPASARLNIPAFNIELDIVSTTASGANLTFNFAQAIGTAVQIVGTGIEGGAGTTSIVTAFITARRSYAAAGGDLRYYPTNDLSNYKVITRNLTSGTPFTIPLTPGPPGSPPTPQNHYVAAVDLTTVDPRTSERGYGAVNMFISSKIPFRCRLTNTQ